MVRRSLLAGGLLAVAALLGSVNDATAQIMCNGAQFGLYKTKGKMHLADVEGFDSRLNTLAHTSGRIKKISFKYYTIDSMRGNKLADFPVVGSIVFDGNGNITTEKKTDDKGQVVMNLYRYNSSGKLILKNGEQVAEPTDGAYKDEFDKMGNHIKRTFLVGQQEYRAHYDAGGNCISEGVYGVSAVNPADSFVIRYDKNGRCTGCTEYIDKKMAGGLEFTYDARGNRITEEWSDVQHEVKVVTMVFAYEYTYDKQGNIVKQIERSGPDNLSMEVTGKYEATVEYY